MSGAITGQLLLTQMYKTVNLASHEEQAIKQPSSMASVSVLAFSFLP